MLVPSRSQSRAAQLLLAVLTTLVVAFSFGTSAATAAPGPNQTLLTLDPVLATGLKVAGVKVTPTGATTSGSAGLYFPVTNSGSVTDAFIGTTKHQGGFQLQFGSFKLGFRNLVVKTTKPAAGKPITGSVVAEPVVMGNGLGFQIPLSKITVTSVQQRSPGVVAKYKLVIDETINALINKLAGVTLIKPGQAWATLETRIARTAVPATTPATT